MNKINTVLENTWNKIKNHLENLSSHIWEYFLYVFIIYALISIYHFKPSLYSYENMTIYFILYLFVIIFYKKEFFTDFIKSYLSTIDASFKYIKKILPFIIFFWIYLFYISWENLANLQWSLMLLYIAMIFILVYNKNHTILELQKYNYKKKRFYIFNIIISITIFLFFKVVLIKNNIKDTNFLLLTILAIYNLILYYIFTDLFKDLKEKIASIYKEKFKKNN